MGQEQDRALIIFHITKHKHWYLIPFHPIRHFGNYLHSIRLPYLNEEKLLPLNHRTLSSCFIFLLLPNNDQLMAHQNAQLYLSALTYNNFYHAHALLTLRIAFFTLNYPSNFSSIPNPKIIGVQCPILCKVRSSIQVEITVLCEF